MGLQTLPQLLSVCLLVWGWVEYSKTSKEKCIDTDPEFDINPRILALVFLIMGSICFPCSLLVICFQIVAPTGFSGSDQLAGGQLDRGDNKEPNRGDNNEPVAVAVANVIGYEP